MELTDVLLAYQFGTFLFESKALKALSSPNLPTRVELTKRLLKHVAKAHKQLIGAARSLRRGLPVTNVAGQEIFVEREQPPHAIILVPDLELLAGVGSLDGGFFRRACLELNGFFHILDPTELLRILQAAMTISERSAGEVLPLAALDHYLVDRAQTALTQRSPAFNVLFR